MMLNHMVATSLMSALSYVVMQLPGCFATVTGADPNCKITPNLAAEKATLEATQLAPTCPYVTQGQNEFVNYRFLMVAPEQAYAGEATVLYLRDLNGNTVLYPTAAIWQGMEGNSSYGGGADLDLTGTMVGSTMDIDGHGYTVDVGKFLSEEPPGGPGSGFPVQFTISMAGGPDATGDLGGGCQDPVTCSYNVVPYRNKIGYRWAQWKTPGGQRLAMGWSVNHPCPMAGWCTVVFSDMRTDWSIYTRSITTLVHIGMPMSDPGTVYARNPVTVSAVPVGGHGAVAQTWSVKNNFGSPIPFRASATSVTFTPPHNGWYSIGTTGHDAAGNTGQGNRTIAVVCPKGVKTTVIVGGGGGTC